MLKAINQKQNILGIMFFILGTAFTHAAGPSSSSAVTPGIALQTGIALHDNISAGPLRKHALEFVKELCTLVAQAIPVSGSLFNCACFNWLMASNPELDDFKKLAQQNPYLHIGNKGSMVFVDFQDPLNPIWTLSSLKYGLFGDGYQIFLEGFGQKICFSQNSTSGTIESMNDRGEITRVMKYREENSDRRHARFFVFKQHVEDLLENLPKQCEVIPPLCKALAKLILNRAQRHPELATYYISTVLESPVLQGLAIDYIGPNGLHSVTKENARICLSLGFVEPYCLDLRVDNKGIQLEKKLDPATGKFALTLLLKTDGDPREYKVDLQESRGTQDIEILCHKLKIAAHLSDLRSGVGGLFCTME